MLSIKPKIASTNILEDVSSSTTISSCFDRYRKNIVLNLLRYFIRPYTFYFQTNIFYQPVTSVATALLSQREVWGSFLGPVESDTVSPLTRHQFWSSKVCCYKIYFTRYIFGVRRCVAQALSRGAPALITRFGI